MIMSIGAGEKRPIVKNDALAIATMMSVTVTCDHRVVDGALGAAMLKDQKLLARVLGQMRSTVKGLLSAKIRAGFDDSTHTVGIAKVVEDCGVDFITVHPRRRCDFYQGVADWRVIRELKEELGIPVIGNGDVWYADDAARMMAETGADAEMIGRPALRTPWIFAQVHARSCGDEPSRPSGLNVLAHLAELHELFSVDGARDESVLGKLKEQARWLGRAVPDGGVFAQTLLRARCISELFDVATFHLERLGPAALDLCADGHLRLESSGSAVSRLAPIGTVVESPHANV
jgi:tRNA-dihydrouridine synthase